MKYKKRKSSSYLVVSSAFLGYDIEILKIFGLIAKTLKAKPIHAGQVSADKDINEITKLKKQLIEEQSKEVVTDKQEESKELKIEFLKTQISALEKQEAGVVSDINKYLGNTLFVMSENGTLSPKRGGDRHYGPLELSKYLTIYPFNPSTIKSITKPVGMHASNVMRGGKSWIAPHPVPTLNTHARPGLNEASSFYSTGSLLKPDNPTKSSEQFKIAHDPACVLVTVDDENGEFHATHLHVDTIAGKYAVLYDGLCFYKDKVIEVSSQDKASHWTDVHVPYQHPGSVAAIMALNLLHKPGTFVDGGDTADFSSLPHHNREQIGERENKRLIYELRMLKKTLDTVTNFPSIRERVLVDSNHHEWLTGFVLENPCLIGILDWPTLARKLLPKWNVFLRRAGENKIYEFGDLSIRHGDKDGGVKKAEKTFPSGKWIGGHFHSRESYRRASLIGCSCKLGPQYIGNSINAWQNEVTSITKYKGITSHSGKVVLHDKKREVSRICYRNEIIEAPHVYITLDEESINDFDAL